MEFNHLFLSSSFNFQCSRQSEFDFKVCFFGCEIGWMENFGEKMRRKTFLSVFGWLERKENKLWGPGVFSPGLHIVFFPKWREN